ncbi:N-acetylmuramoyl-L-alanine amidase [Streptomyces sp. NPDC002018]|uniref:N-acetylmuramoyl-L-alanine amidase n=1 Tax=Streptomyces sp. NPDC002018 TaxID=3364629 RepID=UPI00367D79E9
MSYHESHQPDEIHGDRRPHRRSGRRTLTVAVAALVPGALAGWLVWQVMSGPDGGEPPADTVAGASSGASSGTSSGASSGASSSGASTAPSPPAGARSSSPKPSGAAGGVHDDVPGSAEPDGPAAHGPLAGKVVVIDPGHNPRNREHATEINAQVNIGTTSKECDTTGTSTDDGYAEAAFTLDVSHRLRALLRKLGATVVLTHDNNRPFGPCVDERARIGNKAKADAVISVHADGSAPGNRGFHVILPASVKGGQADTRAIVAPSRELGERVVGNFLRETGTAPANYLGGGTGLDVRKDLGGLNLSKVPKVFVECGNMRDAHDAALLTDPKWRQKAAKGMADGIRGFLVK